MIVQWEYMSLTNTGLVDAKELNQFGDKGWELVAIKEVTNIEEACEALPENVVDTIKDGEYPTMQELTDAVGDALYLYYFKRVRGMAIKSTPS